MTILLKFLNHERVGVWNLHYTEEMTSG